MRKHTKQAAKAIAIGMAGGGIEFAATSGWMHRSQTHNSWKLSKPLEISARSAIWAAGVKPRVWAAVHRLHHAYADTEGDPHSPVMQGRWGVLKLLVRNPFLYHHAAHQLTDEDLPHDLQPDSLDYHIFDHQKAGLTASFAGHVAANKVVGNPVYMAALSYGVDKAVYVAGGNFVNSIGHAGKHPWKALFTGTIESNSDRNYGANSAIVGALTLGEGMQRFHHDHPQEVLFGPEDELSWRQRAFRDILGTAALVLIKAGAASRGFGETPPLPQRAV